MEVTIRGTARLAPKSSALGLGTLVGVAVLLVISVVNWRDISQLQGNFDQKLAQLEIRIGQVSDQVSNIKTAAAAPARRGPDPNRVYTFKTDGAPAKGAASAAITITEFSDFQ